MVKVKILKNFENEFGYKYIKKAIFYASEHPSGDNLGIVSYRFFGKDDIEIDREGFDCQELDWLIEGMSEFGWI